MRRTGRTTRYHAAVNMDGDANPDLTHILARVAGGEQGAADELLPMVYEQLRRIAAARMAGERRDHTLQATALVHEAYARMMGGGSASWANRRHFYFAAAESMRRILIEHARARSRLKRGGPGMRRRALDFAAIADLAVENKGEEVLALDDALRRLKDERPRAAEVVTLRFFAGLGVREVADLLGVSPRTVELDWAFARAWLFREIASENGESD